MNPLALPEAQKRKKENYHTLACFKKWGKRQDIIFYYIHFEITGDPCNLIGSHRCDLFTKSTFFSKLEFSPTKWNWRTTFATFWRPDYYWIKKAFLQTKKFLHLRNWILRFQNGHNKVVCKLRFVKSYLWFQIKLVLHTPLIWIHSYAHMI